MDHFATDRQISKTDELDYRQPIALMAAMVAYLAISNLLERGIPRSHRRGVSLVKKDSYDQAIEHFDLER